MRRFLQQLQMAFRLICLVCGTVLGLSQKLGILGSVDSFFYEKLSINSNIRVLESCSSVHRDSGMAREVTGRHTL